MATNQHNTPGGVYPKSLMHVYNGIIQRCYNSGAIAYKNYGGRGIRVCDDWLDKQAGHERFYKWALASGYAKGLTLDRVNNDGDYSPDNCRWVSRFVQNNNQRSKSKYFRGVEKLPQGTFRVKLTIKGKQVINKTFADLDSAITARLDADKRNGLQRRS